MLVERLKESNLPKEFLDLIHSTCTECGEKLVITESLTRLYCPNIRCRGKVVDNLYNMLLKLNIDYITRSDCEIFVEKYDIKNHFAIFDYQPSVDGELYEDFGESKSNKLYDDLDTYKTSLDLYQYIELANLYNTRDCEKFIFINYVNIDKFYDALYTSGIGFIENLLKYRGTSEIVDTYEGTSIKAYNIYRELLDYEKLLKEYAKLFTFSGDEDLSLKINLTVGVVGDLDSPTLIEIKEELKFSKYITVHFTDVLDTNCIFIIDLNGVLIANDDNSELVKLYKDTELYKIIRTLDIEIFTPSECVGKIKQVIDLMGKIDDEQNIV